MEVFAVVPGIVSELPYLRTSGTYLLHLRLTQPLNQLAIGRLGRFDLVAGHYYYVGSAFGAGGLAARLRRHCLVNKRPHWHIDYLRPYLELEMIWVATGKERLECRWCTALATVPGLVRPVPHFGASDTGCGGHLFYATMAVPNIATWLAGDRQ
ncbi:MAG: GIY-YIG nuclease family protein [Chloroflexi bacterium]|jgi:Uri superfamily endonuclease|nr:MAG: GIY-YIG nuclease family protein [Chloroflexota bacterium]